MNPVIVEARDDSIQAILASATTPVLLDFWAPWCGPCKALAPILDVFAEEQQGKVLVVKINIDENPVAQKKYSIRSIPSLVLIGQGEVVGLKTGVLNKAQLSNFVALA